MNIGLIGYGKMGKIIEQTAIQRGHIVNLKIDINNINDFTVLNLKKSDVVIEFTGPHSAYENVMKCLEADVAVVCGSTGWLEQYDRAMEYCEKNREAFYMPVISALVSIFFLKSINYWQS